MVAQSTEARFQLLGEFVDLQATISLRRRCLALCTQNVDVTQLFTNQSSLCTNLCWLFQREKNYDIITEAISHGRSSLKIAEPNSSDFLTASSNLASAHHSRFEHFGSEGDLTISIELLRGALRIAEGQSDQSQLALVRNNLASCLRGNIRQNINPIGVVLECIALATLSIEATPRKSHDFPSRQHNLACLLGEKFCQRGDLRDLDEAIKLVEHLLEDSNLRLSSELHASFSQTLGIFLVLHALAAYRKALEILPQTMLLGKQYRNGGILDAHNADVGLDGAACSIECGKPSLALEILEHGRCIAWTRSLQTRTAFDSLKEDHPGHADRLIQLGEMIEMVGTEQSRAEERDGRTTAPSVDLEIAPWEQSLSYGRQWDALLAEIRAMPNYHDFLLPAKYDDLRAIASCGPVIVVNISTYRSDALIVAHATHDRPQIVPLSRRLVNDVRQWYDILSKGTADFENGLVLENHFNEAILGPVLVGLWEGIVRPICDALRLLAPYARRIWWCPTGQLTFLPLHVVTNSPDMLDNAMLLIPSYTSTLSSLLRAAKATGTSTSSTRILAVGCAKADGYTDLPGTDNEITSLVKIFGEGEVTCLTNGDATVERVLGSLSEHPWVHLACHGTQMHERPFRSHFVLRDRPLYMSDIVAHKLPEPSFAFLSSCHTAAGVPSLYDEAMHLAAALHIIGFRAVIAAQWAVDDSTAPRLVREVYSYLNNGRNPAQIPHVEDAAEALYHAVCALRRHGVPLSRLAPFIHIGV
ncbi:hypothetical protein BD410DRAFT_726949 [Rickenella mellea]|uniref:CHAT domain-containing protein n=1 Tax=Rickenella mellea TaxID=50990 RepID=A0A4Y7PXK0_9AGAM|nr:hypothetical protein BD410DRAFT_726949 [Rickenella mellea]